MDRKELLRKENEWIDEIFDIDISERFITESQIKLLESGFPVDLIKDKPYIESKDKVIKEMVESLIKK